MGTGVARLESPEGCSPGEDKKYSTKVALKKASVTMWYLIDAFKTVLHALDGMISSILHILRF